MESPYHVARFYAFAPFQDYEAWQGRLKGIMLAGGLRGTILLAEEGINGTVAGPRTGLDELFAALRQHPSFEGLSPVFTPAAAIPFEKIKVRLKREIITFRQGVDVTQTGEYLDPAAWNRLLEDPRTLVLDTRNRFEFYHGRFRGAVDPDTERFSELPAVLESQKDTWGTRPVAMYCTGGIRCEKASAYARALGYEKVYQLKGGILGYLEAMPPDQSLWEGACFVFDDRETV